MVAGPKSSLICLARSEATPRQSLLPAPRRRGGTPSTVALAPTPIHQPKFTGRQAYRDCHLLAIITALPNMSTRIAAPSLPQILWIQALSALGRIPFSKYQILAESR